MVEIDQAYLNSYWGKSLNKNQLDILFQLLGGLRRFGDIILKQQKDTAEISIIQFIPKEELRIEEVERVTQLGKAHSFKQSSIQYKRNETYPCYEIILKKEEERESDKSIP